MFGSKFLGGNIWGANSFEWIFLGGRAQNGEQFLIKANFLGRKF